MSANIHAPGRHHAPSPTRPVLGAGLTDTAAVIMAGRKSEQESSSNVTADVSGLPRRNTNVLLPPR